MLAGKEINKIIKSTLTGSIIGILFSVLPAESIVPASKRKYNRNDFEPVLTAVEDTTRKKSKYATYEEKDRYGDPISNPRSKSAFLLKDPGNKNFVMELDTSGDYFNVYERIGNEIDYKNPTIITYEEYERYQKKEAAKNYWKTKQAGEQGEGPLASKRLIPKVYLPPEVDRIFGGNYVDLKPSGSVTIRLGGRWQRVDNPSLSIPQQRNGGFDFDQTIQMNVQGKIGEKLRLNINWDTKANFDFENNIKLQYTAFPEDIIQKIEAGNINFPLNSQLIQGSQQLFGVKTQLRFGRLWVTSVASNQRGKVEEIIINGGTQSKVNEIVSSDYEDDRHYFLSHYFRNNYERALANLPLVNSPVNITRIEVYVMNYSRQVDNLRNIMAFADLGEVNPHHTYNIPGNPYSNKFPDNGSNYLKNYVLSDAAQRNVIDLYGYGMVKGTDFEAIQRARKMKETEYKYNKQLGYISLNTPLRADEMLAVSYEYTLNGRTYRVGELQDDYQNYDAESSIILKLLKPTSIRKDLPMWDLMMKNIYNLGTSQISRDNFLLQVIYKDDLSGVDNPSLHEGKNTKNKLLLQLFGLDKVNNNNDPPSDGNFDFLEGVTVDAQNGRIYFPVLEPFGSFLERQFDPETESDLIFKYVYDSLYTTRRAQAKQQADKDKFFIRVRYQSGSGGDINLPGFNIQPGSVKVTAGGMQLTENQDFTVNYDLNRLKITNQGVLSSGKDIKIQFEKTEAFLVRQKTMLGTRLDYKLNQDMVFGSTIMYLNERPLVRRVAVGDEPIRNTMIGLDGTYRKDSKILTKIVDKIPGIQTKEMSNVALTGEFAQLIPGSSPYLGKGGTSYIDDFEGSEIVYSLLTPSVNWKLASAPTTLLPTDVFVNPLKSGYNRARMAWYVVDQVFYRSGNTNRPDYITEDDMKNHYIRSVGPQEVFPNKQLQAAASNMQILDLAYYPHERGMYNYNPDLTDKGMLRNPEISWGGISRAFTTDTDFDNANVQYIEFWIMDPFIAGDRGKVMDGIYNQNNTTGGFLYFNLGNISEDVLNDGKFEFENGLPESQEEFTDANLDTTVFGVVTNKQYINDAFSNLGGTRQFQDRGLDGINDDGERSFFTNYLNQINSSVADSAKSSIFGDPANDNFKHYLSTEFTDNKLPIQQLYKYYNGMENNTPENANAGGFTQLGNTQPDKEDLNRDNTISDVEGYYEYKIPLIPGKIQIGQNYCVNKQTNLINGDEVTWYQFRIPIRTYDKKVGAIDGFKTIRFMRTYLNGFKQPVVLRFAQLQLVANPWREYIGDLSDPRPQITPEPVADKFIISTVNIEKNGKTDSGEIPYQLPPNTYRDYDLTSVIQRQQNEQSLQMCVENLADQKAVAVFKNISFDLQMYKNLKMFIHAQGNEIGNDEMHAFVRLGTDFTDNYYEYEVPLKITAKAGSYTAESIWLADNEVDIVLENFFDLKLERDNVRANKIYPYSKSINGKIITVVGQPDISAVRVALIGLRNPKTDDKRPRSVCMWVNELRVTEFQNKGGWGAVGSMNTKLADFATLSVNGKITTPGFGSINQKLQQRQRNTAAQYDIGSNINLHKFLPEKLGLRLPMFVGYEKNSILPQYNPIDPDIEMKKLKETNDSTYQFVKSKIVDQSVRRSINFTNIQKVKTGKNPKSHIWDIENINLTLAYSDLKRKNVFTEYNNTYNYKGAIGYNYSPKFKGFAPFEKAKFGKSPYFKLIKDINFNPIPTMIGVRVSYDRMFNEVLYRNSNLDTLGMTPFYNKAFTTTRNYDMRWSLTKALTVDYTVATNARIDEPYGKLDTQAKKDSVWNNVKNLGRTTKFGQVASANYKIPFDKMPLTNWLSADVRYGAKYDWTASSLALTQNDTLNLGNLIQNNRERSINGRVNLETLYNKVKFLKSINTPPPPKKELKKSILEDPKTKNDPKNPKDPKAKDSKDSTEVKPRELKMLKTALRVLMGVRSINFNYAINDGTTLPGFMGGTGLFGLDKKTGQPGLPFTFGDQFVPDVSKFAQFRQDADAQNLITRSPYLYNNMMYNRTETFTTTTQVEPFKDFKVTVNAKINRNGNYQELFKNDTIPGSNKYISLSPLSTGNHTISYISFGTMFRRKSDGNNNSSPLFQEFLDSRLGMAQRLNLINPSAKNFYTETSQDVLIPAFVETYSGRKYRSPNNPFYSFPLPNWRLDYSGLSKLEAVKKKFSSINLSHSYTGSYTTGNFITSLQYQTPFTQSNYFFTPNPSLTLYPFIVNEKGELIPYNIINGVSLTDKFGPLIGIDIKTKTKITINTQYDMERVLLLALNNLQLTETNGQSIIIGMGYTTNNFKVPFRVQGDVVVLKNDLTFKVDFLLKETKITQRTFEGTNTVTGASIRTFQLKPNISYLINQRVTIQFYFERTVNTPLTTGSFRTSQTAGGVQFRFQLS